MSCSLIGGNYTLPLILGAGLFYARRPYAECSDKRELSGIQMSAYRKLNSPEKPFQRVGQEALFAHQTRPECVEIQKRQLWTWPCLAWCLSLKDLGLSGAGEVLSVCPGMCVSIPNWPTAGDP